MGPLGAQANYYRDPRRLDDYKAGALFLPDVNNEAMPPNASAAYATNFASLSQLVRPSPHAQVRLKSCGRPKAGWCDSMVCPIQCTPF